MKGLRVLTALIVSILAISLFPAISYAQVTVPREETLIYSGYWGEHDIFNPYLAVGGGDAAGHTLMVMYETLFIYSGVMDKWLPWLAEGYRWINASTFEVKIRPQARWWDNRSVTAYDVEYTFKLGKRYTIPGLTPYWEYFKDIRVVDDKTVWFILDERKMNYFMLFNALSSVFILPKHRWEQLEAQYGEKLFTEFKDSDVNKIIASGPYKPLYWTTDVQVFIRNDNWWGKEIFGLPKPKYFMHPKPRDHPDIYLRFEKGDIDISTHGIPAVYELWEKKGLARGTYLKEMPYQLPNTVWVLAINYKNDILNNPAVKLAIAYAIPYEDIIEKAWTYYSVKPTPTPLIHYYPEIEQFINWSIVEKYLGGDRFFSYDPEKAKKILDQAGIIDRDGDGIRELPDGRKLRITIEVTYGWSDSMMIAELIADSLKKIGFDAKTYFPDFSTYMSRISNLEYEAVLTWGAGVGNPLYYVWSIYRWFLDSRLRWPAGNPSGYNPPYADEINRIIDEMPSQVYNLTRFREMADKLLEYWMKDLPAIVVVYIPWWYQYSEDYWVGFPNQDRPYTQGWWVGPMWGPNKLPIFFYIVSRSEYDKGVRPTIPRWMLDLPIPTSKILEDLISVISKQTTTTSPVIVTTSPTMTTVTVTTAITMTQTSVVTVPTTSITTTTITTTDYTVTGVAAIITLIVGLAIGWLIFRRR